MPRTAAQILHDARWMVGLTQAEVAQRAGVSQQMIAQYERGKKQPSFATLAALVAGCGVELTTHLVPRPGLEDEPTRELLARPLPERLPEPFRTAVIHVAEAATGVPFLIGGRAAARLHGAVVTITALELWFPSDLDLDAITAFLQRLGAAEVGLYSADSEPIADRELFDAEWSVAGPDTDLRLRSLTDYGELQRRAGELHLPGLDLPVSFADPHDAIAWWHPRDMSHLALQRALRLAEERRSATSDWLSPGRISH